MKVLARRLALAGALLLAIAIGAGVLAWSKRTALVEWWLAREVAARGIEPASFRVTRFETDGIAIEAIAAGAPAAPDLAIEHVEAAWSRESLREGRLLSLRVRGVALQARLGEHGLSLGSLDPLWRSGGGASSAPVLPAPEIEIETARLRVETPQGLATGTLGGKLRQSADGIEGELALDIAGAGLTAHGRLTLGGTLDAPSFRIRLDPLLAGALRLRLDARGAISKEGIATIETGTLHFAGGTIRVGRTKLDPNAKQSKVTLRAEKLDLAALLAIANLEGLDGTGRLAGELPLVRTREGLHVDAGLLHATGTGTIRYAASESIRSMAASRPADLGLAVEAFSDFHYDLLEARLSGDLTGELAIGLHVRGSNPSFHEGHPVELNLNLESRLLDLVRAGAESYRVPEQIEERVRKQAKEKR